MNLCFVPSFYLFLQEFLYFLFSQSLSSEHPPCVYRTLLPAVCVCVCVQKDQQNISALSGGRGKNHRASTRHWFTHKYVRNFCFSKTHPSLIGWSDLLGSDCCWGFVDWTDRSRALHCVIKKKKEKRKRTLTLCQMSFLDNEETVSPMFVHFLWGFMTPGCFIPRTEHQQRPGPAVNWVNCSPTSFHNAKIKTLSLFNPFL